MSPSRDGVIGIVCALDIYTQSTHRSHTPFTCNRPRSPIHSVGDWELGEKLGEGQFAKVFACRGPRRDKDYALKVRLLLAFFGGVLAWPNLTRHVIFTIPPPPGDQQGQDQQPGGAEACGQRGGRPAHAPAPRHPSGRLTNGCIVSCARRSTCDAGAIQNIHACQVKEVLNGRYGLYVIMEMGGKDLFDFVEEQQQAHAPATAAGADSDSDDEEDESTPTPLQRGIVVSEANCRVLARNLVDAIAFCHANGIAHRDLKVA